MLREAKQQCDYLIVCLHEDPSVERATKQAPVQTVEERRIQLQGCRYVDEIIDYRTETDLLTILVDTDWDVRIIGQDWYDKPFTGRDLPKGQIHFNARDHGFSTEELRARIRDAPTVETTPEA
jgi:glycerol-3-phosphate cytidylyltransferase